MAGEEHVGCSPRWTLKKAASAPGHLVARPLGLRGIGSSMTSPTFLGIEDQVDEPLSRSTSVGLVLRISRIVLYNTYSWYRFLRQLDWLAVLFRLPILGFLPPMVRTFSPRTD